MANTSTIRLQITLKTNMKSYIEAIEFVANEIQNGTLRYNSWPAKKLIGEIYGIKREQVDADIERELIHRRKAAIYLTIKNVFSANTSQ